MHHFAPNKRAGQDVPEMRNGLVEVDFGHGRINLRGLTAEEQDRILDAKGYAPNGKSLAYMPLAEIKLAMQKSDLAQVEGGRSFSAPKLGRIS